MAGYRKPLHPPLTDFPVALWTIAVVFDVLSFRFGTSMVHAAYYNLALGAVFAVGAAVTGALDYSRLQAGTRATRLGAVHAAVNVAATVLFLVSLWFRTWELGRASTPLPAFAFSLVGLGLLAAGARLGSRLVFQLGANVKTVPQVVEPDAGPLVPTRDRTPLRP